MAAPQNFRSAFNGFNREDVVNYISYITGKHENQLNQVRTEMENLRAEYESKAQNPQESEEMEALRNELEQKDRLIAQLTEELDKKEAATETLKERELGAYRRAENAERRAMERVNLMYDKANSVIAELICRMGQSTEEMDNAISQIRQGLDQLYKTVDESTAGLNNSIDLLSAIRQEDK